MTFPRETPGPWLQNTNISFNEQSDVPSTYLAASEWIERPYDGNGKEDHVFLGH